MAAGNVQHPHGGRTTPDLAEMREQHQAKVAELDALAASEAAASGGAGDGLGASLGGKALGQEFAKRNPELAFFYGVNGAPTVSPDP